MSPSRHGGAPPRVLITRAQEDAEPLAQAVRQLGAVPLCVPAVRTEPLALPGPLARLGGPLGDWRAIGFASRRGVQGLAQALQHEALILPAHTELFAVGPSTERMVQHHFGRSAQVPLPHTAVGLATHMARVLPQQARVLLPTAMGAGDVLHQTLSAAGLRPVLLPLYQTLAVQPAAEAMTAARNVDYIVFTSPSCVQSWAQWGHIPTQARLLTMGPSTSQAALALGLAIAGEANPSSFAGLTALLDAMLCPA